jgi:hypothetical protein
LNDQIRSEGVIRNIIIGDEATLQLNLPSNDNVMFDTVIVNSLPCTYVSQVNASVMVDANGADTITTLSQSGSSIIIGGGAMDTITNIDSILTVIIGDHGSVTTTRTVGGFITLGSVNSTQAMVDESLQNSNDAITVILPAEGRTVVIGGTDNDHITISTSNDDEYGDAIICGDDCIATFGNGGSGVSINSHFTLSSYDDQIQVSGIANVFGIGGDGNDDIIVTKTSFATLLGDDGLLVIDGGYRGTQEGSTNGLVAPLTVPSWIESTRIDVNGLFPSQGNDRLMVSTILPPSGYYTTARAIVFGGHHDDTITTKGASAALCGDDCQCKPSFPSLSRDLMVINDINHRVSRQCFASICVVTITVWWP